MKKLFAILMSMTLFASITVASLAAGELSSVTVTSPKTSNIASATFPSGVDGNKGELDITKLMTEIGNLTATKDIVQDIEIKSISANYSPVEFELLIELPEDNNQTSVDEYSAVDYYNVKVTDSLGRTIYDDEKNEIEPGLEQKVINLGILNENNQKSSSVTYKIYVSVNEDVDAQRLVDDPDDVLWKISYTDDSRQFAPTASPYAGNVSTMLPSTSSTPSPGTTIAPTATASAKTKVITCQTKEGEDTIKPGSYRIIGKGHVVIKDEDGKVKAEFDLKTTPDAVTVVNEGDVITLTGGTDAYVQFKAPEATATAKPTATPKTTAKPTATPKATAKPTATAKANPKTGDMAPIAGVGVIAALALGMVVYIGVTSKKKEKK